MTVDEFEMNVRARGTRAGLDDNSDERWRGLPDLSDGHREKWMTDRAKHALGTPKLASIFLQEEKGRIYRLRKIKSVLASGKLMGNVGGTMSSSTSQPDRRGKRRLHPNPSQHHSHHMYHTNHRRFQLTESTDVKPNYPTNPFGNVCNDTLQFPAPMGRRSSLEETVRNEVNMHTKHSSMDRSGVARVDGSLAIEQVVSALGGGKEGSHRSRTDLVRFNEAPLTRGDKNGSLLSHFRGSSDGSDFTSEKRQLLQGLASHSKSKAMVEGNQAISSGPSAIDLFDQCGLIPRAAEEKEGLVGTTNMLQPSRESDKCDIAGRKTLVMSVTDTIPANYHITPALAAPPRPPLIPGGASSTSDFRGTGNNSRKVTRVSARQPQAAATHGVRPRPPFASGGISTLSRSKLAQQQASPSSSSGKDAVAGSPKPNGRLRRGVPSDAAATESTSRRSRIAPQSNTGNPLTVTSKPTAKTDGRSRRRWNVDAASPTTATSSGPQAPPGVPSVGGAAGFDTFKPEPPSVSASASGSASACEQRIASAKERLHKNKDLEALKSEHVEALSILQDISCPSTATAAVEVAHGASTQEDGRSSLVVDDTVEAARKSLLHEREDNMSTSNGASPGWGLGRECVPTDVEVDQLSSDLPRIGSQEQAALRAMYRKWWMKVANGGSPPSSGTPAGLLEAPDNAPTGQNPSLIDKGQTDERGTVQSFGQQVVPVQERVMTGNTEPGQEETLAARAASEVRNMDVSNGKGQTGSVARTEREKLPKNEEADDVGPDAGRGVEEVVLDTSGVINVASLTGLKGGRPEDVIILDHGRESALAGGVELGTTDAPTTGAAASAEAPKGPPPAEEANYSPPPLASPPQQQAMASDVESVSEDDGLVKEQEEGHHGRIYLPDGRFVSTWRNSAGKEMIDAVENVQNLGEADGCDGKGDGEVVVNEPLAKGLDEDSVGYADEDFEFED